MTGRAPFRAHSRFPPNGTYCWLRGKLSVFRSCRRCFSLKMEWTVFRNSFLLSGELREEKEEAVLSVCHCWEQQEGAALKLKSVVKLRTPSGENPHLQHRWSVLSGLPSDSDFVWTISHIAEFSPSVEYKHLNHSQKKVEFKLQGCI